MLKEEIIETVSTLSLAQRRAFIRLPVEERRRQMAAQAERALERYEGEREASEREDWQGGDIVEY